MSKNTQISELINFISVDGSGNVVFTTVPAATTNTDKFLVSDAGTLKFRTATQLLSDIGAQASLTNPVTGTGSAGQLAYWSSGSAITGEANLFWDSTNDRLGVGTITPLGILQVSGTNAAHGTTGIPTIPTLLLNRATNNASNYAGLEIQTEAASSNFGLYSNQNGALFYHGGTERWRITSTGVLQSNGLQTIQTSTGNLTIATGGGDGNILLSPNGTGNVGVGTTPSGAKLDVLGNFRVRRDINANQYLDILSGGGFVNILAYNGNSSTIFQELIFQSGNTTSTVERWKITSTGGFQSNGSQTIQTSTGNLILTSADNTGVVDIRRTDRALGAELRITNSFNGLGWLAGDIVGTLNFYSPDTSTTQPIRSQIQAISTSGTTYPTSMNLTFSTANGNTLTEGFRLTNLSNVHIGPFTSDNGARLQVNGVSASSALSLRNTTGGTLADFIITENIGLIVNSYEGASARSIDFRVADTSALLIASTGAATFSSSVTSLAASPLVASVSSNSANDAIVAARWTSGLGMEMRYTPNTAVGFIQNTYPVEVNEPFGDIQFRSSIGGTMTPRMIIKGYSGNVGIGTDTPTAGKLVVNGNISISGNNYLDFNNGDARIVNTSGQLSFQTYTVGSFATRMIITGPGNVGIGASSLLERLSVNGNIHVEGVGNSIYFDTDGNGRSIQQYVTNLYQFHIVNGRGNSARFMLGNGSITLGTSSTPQFTINTTNGASSFISTVTSSGGFIGSLSGNASTASKPAALASRSGNFSSGTANGTENVDISSYYLPYFGPVYFYFNMQYNGNGAIGANWFGLADAHYFNNGTANIIWTDDGASGGASMPSVSVSVQGSTYNTRYLRFTVTATGGYAPNNWNWSFGVWNAFP